jgi:hypothetical protein
VCPEPNGFKRLVAVQGCCGAQVDDMSTPDDVSTVFDEPVRWRLDAARAMCFSKVQLIAALSPGPAFPAALRSVTSALPPDIHSWLDVGAGGGGASEWWRCATGAEVTAIEPSPTSRDVATTSFPQLDVRPGTVDLDGWDSTSADVISMCGVLSLLPDARAPIARSREVARSGGHLVIADLFAAGQDAEIGPNHFRSIASVCELVVDLGATVVHVGAGSAQPSPEWRAAPKLVDQWICAHCADQPGFTTWSDDVEHLREVAERGLVIGGCVVARWA